MLVFNFFRRKKLTDEDMKQFSHEEIQSHPTIRDEIFCIDFKGIGFDTVHRVELKQVPESPKLTYLVFTYVSGLAVMNWNYEHYVLANKKIAIGNTPIYYYVGGFDKTPTAISMSYREK